MSLRKFSGELTPSPTAEECRALLIGLTPTREKRNGSCLTGLFLIVTCFTLPALFIFLVILDGSWIPKDYKVPLSMVIFFLSFVLCLYLASREQKLYNRNCVKELEEYLKPMLNRGEELLTLCVGRASSFKTPEWLGNVSPYSYFVFTTDRLLVINFDASLNGTNLINKEISNQSIGYYIRSIITCSLIDKSKCRFGGFITIELLLNFLFTKVEVFPVNESHSYTWLIDDKFTQSAKLLRTIRHRIANTASVTA